jgi:peptidoglycan hydrolase-like protein with peptidoglycan-binding domain
VPAVARPGAADPASQEAALGLDPTRIREIQRRLTSLGHDTRGADGKLGPGSRAAIASFQRAHGLPATGFIGPSDLNSLGIAR